jgi:antibiotic biosynthesis monooxygenase (ABM) superfamily enzyme
MSASPGQRADWRLRLAVISTLVAVVLAFALLLKETANLFTVFMFLGPTLLLVAVVLLGWSILEELRSKKVL